MVELPKELYEKLATGEDAYVFGGRVGYKSTGISQFMILESLKIKHKDEVFLCAREYQSSISNSSYAVIKGWISKMGLDSHFHIGKEVITALKTGVRFVFKGLQDTASIKSIEGLSLVWIEEGETLKKSSYTDVYDTAIRNPNCQMIVSMNLRYRTDYSFKLVEDHYEKAMTSGKSLMFFNGEHDGDHVNVVYVNYLANKWVPDLTKKKINKLKRKDFAEYRQRYLGALRENNKAAVFPPNYYTITKVKHDPECEALQGLDFGFSTDPYAAIRCHVKNNCLYISGACGRRAVDISDTAQDILKHIPDFDKYRIVGDSARPDSISHLKNKGSARFPHIVASKKGKGSIVDGIEFIKSFDMIYIDESLTEVIHEFGAYSYKLDKTTGEPTSDIADKDNHWIDALRYALEKLMRKNKQTLVPEAF